MLHHSILQIGAHACGRRKAGAVAGGDPLHLVERRLDRPLGGLDLLHTFAKSRFALRTLGALDRVGQAAPGADVELVGVPEILGRPAARDSRYDVDDVSGAQSGGVEIVGVEDSLDLGARGVALDDDIGLLSASLRGKEEGGRDQDQELQDHARFVRPPEALRKSGFLRGRSRLYRRHPPNKERTPAA